MPENCEECGRQSYTVFPCKKCGKPICEYCRTGIEYSKPKHKCSLLGRIRASFTKRNAEIFLLQALIGFVLWTGILTPYMIYGVGVDLDAYLRWVVMELVLVPPVAPFVVRITNYLIKKALK